MQIGVDSAARAVGGFERQRPDNVSQRTARKIDERMNDQLDAAVRGAALRSLVAEDLIESELSSLACCSCYATQYIMASCAP